MSHPGRDIDFNPSVEVDGLNFEVHLFMPSRAFEIGAKLIRLIGEPISNLANAKNVDDETLYTKIIPTAVKSLTQNLDNKEFLTLVKTLISSATHDNKPIAFDEFFHGRLGLLFHLLVQIIMVQFKDFFGGVVKSVQQVAKLGQSAQA